MERHGENAMEVANPKPKPKPKPKPNPNPNPNPKPKPNPNPTPDQVAKMLEGHPLIETLYYPGLPSHPDHELAKRVFTSGGPNSNAAKQTFGGMLAFIVAGDPDTALRRAQRFAERLELVTLAVSLGGDHPQPASTRTPPPAPRHPHPTTTRTQPGTESLVEHPASMTHAMIPREDRLAGGLQEPQPEPEPEP